MDAINGSGRSLTEIKAEAVTASIPPHALALFDEKGGRRRDCRWHRGGVRHFATKLLRYFPTKEEVWSLAVYRKLSSLVLRVFGSPPTPDIKAC